MSEALLPAFDAVGALGFAAAAWMGFRSYRASDVERPYWIAFSVTSALAAAWLVLVAVEWLGFSSALMDDLNTTLQAVVVGLYAVAVVGTRGVVGELRGSRRRTARRASVVSILSRVLRHDVRNDMTVVRGYAEELIDDPDAADKVKRKIDDLVETADKARQLEETVNSPTRYHEVELDRLLRRVKEDVLRSHPDAKVELDCPGDCPVALQPSLQSAVTELVENAAEHAGGAPEIRVNASVDDGWVLLQVRDDGPGLPESEVEVLEEGVETPLYHTTGVGLWLVHWIVDDHGGSVDHDTSDDGTCVTVRLPRSNDDRRPGERYLRRSNTLVDGRSEALDQHVEHGVMAVDSDGRVLEANTAAAEMMSTKPGELMGRRLNTVVPERMEDLVHALDAEETVRGKADAGQGEVEIRYVVHPDYVPGETLVTLYPEPSPDR